MGSKLNLLHGRNNFLPPHGVCCFRHRPRVVLAPVAARTNYTRRHRVYVPRIQAMPKHAHIAVSGGVGGDAELSLGTRKMARVLDDLHLHSALCP